MKKLFLFLMMFSIITASCTSCNSKDVKTDFYAPAYYLVPQNEENPESIMDKVSKPSQKQMDICNEVMSTVSSKLGTSKSVEIWCISDEYFNRTDSISAKARYDYNLNCILIPKSFDEKGKSYLCHEYIHAFSDYENNNIVGLEYILDNGESKYILGQTLNEGICNYFSTKYYKHPQEMSIYEYETHVASILALNYGDKALWEAFTSGNYESIKSDFNSKLSEVYKTEQYDGLELTPFELLETTLDQYECILLYASDYVKEYGLSAWEKDLGVSVNSIEEMVLNYSIKSGNKKEAQNEIQKLLENNSGQIDFESLSKLKELSARS